mmetsp:Transcript_22286/g.35701  ORF Transcript_22286/g.35701 Transcript_22286/m.35701 type:complete len:256 (+) Transcript_22286:30-797(+)
MSALLLSTLFILASKTQVRALPTTIDYGSGWNIQWTVSNPADLAAYVPPPLKLAPMHILDSETTDSYIISLYLGNLTLDEVPEPQVRGDLFTYVTNPNDELLMLYLTVVASPPPFCNTSTCIEEFRLVQQGLSHGLPVKIILNPMVSNTYFEIQGDSGSMSVSASLAKQPPIDSFSRPFVIANSGIYVNGSAKYTNFFNDEFIAAPVRIANMSEVQYHGTKWLFPLCENITSVQQYGNNSAFGIRWYTEPPTSIL